MMPGFATNQAQGDKCGVASRSVSPIGLCSRMKLLKRVGFACISVLPAISLLCVGCGPPPPSDEALEKRFQRQRPALEHLVAMMNEDSQMTRIAPDFIWNRDSVAWPRPESEWGISAQRWNEYRKIFDEASFKQGTSRGADSEDVLILVYTEGLVTSGSAISYLHCGPKAKQQAYAEPPCIDRKESGSGMYGKSTSYGYRYKKITEDWYVYEQFN